MDRLRQGPRRLALAPIADNPPEPGVAQAMAGQGACKRIDMAIGVA